MPRSLPFIAVGTAVGIIVGATLYAHGPAFPGWTTPLLALAVVAVAWLVTRPKRGKASKQVDTYSVAPAVGTKRWARMMYHNGNCSMEELCKWFADNPKAPE